MTSKTPMMSRRFLLGGSAAFLALPACSAESVEGAPSWFSELETSIGGRIGIAATNLATGHVISHRGDERFAFCSSFKWLLGALVLARVDAGQDSLDTVFTYGRDDLLSHSPVLGPAVERGSMSLGELCEATITTSDNAAANILIRHLGGPEGFTQALRRSGDDVTRLDRYELELNEAASGDPRDTSSPHAMMATMGRFLFGDALSAESRALLRTWMIDANTGLTRLRAGIPDAWIAGDKTGTNLTNMNNDIAFAFPPQRSSGPILIVSYLDAPNPLGAERNEVHAEIARHLLGQL